MTKKANDNRDWMDRFTSFRSRQPSASSFHGPTKKERGKYERVKKGHTTGDAGAR